MNQHPPYDELSIFFRAAFSIDLVIFTIENDRLKVLLIKRKETPFPDRLSLPGKLIYPNQETDRTARELAAEVIGSQNFYCKQLKAFTQLDRHPFGRVITIAHLVLVPFQEVEFQPNGLTDEIHWHDLEDMPNLPFDHNLLVETGLQEVRSTVRHIPLVFDLLPDQFTITEARRAFEAIFGETIDKRNFAKKVKKSELIEALEGESKPSRGRKAALFRFRREDYSPGKTAPLNFQY